MSTSTITTPEAGHSPVAGLFTMVAANVVLGVPAHFTAFLFAYGFRDTVGVAEHGAFLVMIGLFGVVTGLVGAGVDAAVTPRRLGWSLAVVVPASVSLNAAAVAVGSIVSAAHKDEGSVSATFSTATDVLVAAGLLGVSLVLALASARALRGSLALAPQGPE